MNVKHANREIDPNVEARGLFGGCFEISQKILKVDSAKLSKVESLRFQVELNSHPIKMTSTRLKTVGSKPESANLPHHLVPELLDGV